MKGILAALLLLAATTIAFAAPPARGSKAAKPTKPAALKPVAKPAATASALPSGYGAHSFDAFGFKLSLPDSGQTATPASAGWDRDPEVAFEWTGAEADPVRLIMARVDDAKTALDEKSFRAFTDQLLSYWNPPQPPGAGAVAKPASPYQVTNTADNLAIGGKTWNLIEVADKSDPKTT